MVSCDDIFINSREHRDITIYRIKKYTEMTNNHIGHGCVGLTILLLPRCTRDSQKIEQSTIHYKKSINESKAHLTKLKG